MTPLNALLSGLMASLVATAAHAATGSVARVGQPVPDLSVTGAQGKALKLSDFKGRHVVLEWVNPGCPYVVKHYGSQNMQAMQKAYASQNVVWLSVNSTRADHADYLKPADMAAWVQKQGAQPAHVVMDTDGRLGRAFDARTTPHLFVVDPKGTLVFAGGVDDIRSTSAEDVPKAKNFVRAALTESLAGRPVAQASPAPYGCSIKY